MLWLRGLRGGAGGLRAYFILQNYFRVQRRREAIPNWESNSVALLPLQIYCIVQLNVSLWRYQCAGSSSSWRHQKHMSTKANAHRRWFIWWEKEGSGQKREEKEIMNNVARFCPQGQVITWKPWLSIFLAVSLIIFLPFKYVTVTMKAVI